MSYNFLLTDASYGLKFNPARAELFIFRKSFHGEVQNYYPASFSGHNQHVNFKPCPPDQGLAEPSCRAPLLFPPSLTWMSLFKIPIRAILNSVVKDLFPAKCWTHLADAVLKRNHMNLLSISSSSLSSPLSACHLWGFQHPSTLSCNTPKM